MICRGGRSEPDRVVESAAGTVVESDREIEGIVKWFNTVKGFGFVTPSDGSNDAFLHLSVLRDAGYSALQPGVTISCVVSSRSKGLQVTRILQVDESTAEPAPQQTTASAEPSAADLRKDDDFDDDIPF